MGQHNGTTKGKRVFVKLKDGTIFVDKFVDSTSTRLHFEEEGWIKKSNVITFSIYRSHVILY